jgi:hypothetical protein
MIHRLFNASPSQVPKRERPKGHHLVLFGSLHLLIGSQLLKPALNSLIQPRTLHHPVIEVIEPMPLPAIVLHRGQALNHAPIPR